MKTEEGEPVGIGVCEVCNFAALIAWGCRFEPRGEKVTRVLVCPTCLSTPAGFPSPNQLHRKLDPEEYRIGG